MDKNIQNGLIVIVILLILAGIKLNSDSKHATTLNTLYTGKIEDVHKILIQEGQDAIELYKDNETWKIAGNDTLEVRENKISNFFDNVLTAGSETLVSNNSEKWDTFSVGDSTGMHLAIINIEDVTIGYYVFGRSKKDWSHNYVRYDNKPEVYLTNTSIIHHINTRDVFWGEIPKPIEIPQDSLNSKLDTLNNF